jgi:predicted hotdog family 3-hydroxylacyl-ACP dehydratase
MFLPTVIATELAAQSVLGRRGAARTTRVSRPAVSSGRLLAVRAARRERRSAAACA